MFNSYLDIYDKRGREYHKAMRKWPSARKHEFETLVSIAAITGKRPVVLDVPSGGGYLADYLSTDATLISVDQAPNFLNAGQHQNVSKTVCAPHDRIPMKDNSCDVILSLAGLHHIEEQKVTFIEWYRLLRSGGTLAIGDAETDSNTAKFLDGVVGKHNSMGHRGLYLTPQHAEVLVEVGFIVTLAEVCAYPWCFSDKANMLAFCRTLFCLDHEPSDDELLADIQRTIGYVESASGCNLQWGLFFLRATKP